MPWHPSASNIQGAPAATPGPASRSPARESTPGSFATISAGSSACWPDGIPASGNTVDDRHCAHEAGTNPHSDNIFEGLGYPSSPPGSKPGRIQHPSSPNTRPRPNLPAPPAPAGRRKKRINPDLQIEEYRATSNRWKKRHFKVVITLDAHSCFCLVPQKVRGVTILTLL